MEIDLEKEWIPVYLKLSLLGSHDPDEAEKLAELKEHLSMANELLGQIFIGESKIKVRTS